MQAKFRFSRPAAALGLMALLGAVPAYAADAVVEEAPAPAAPMEEPPVNTWSGPYAGITLGYGFSGTMTTSAPSARRRSIFSLDWVPGMTVTER